MSMRHMNYVKIKYLVVYLFRKQYKNKTIHFLCLCPIINIIITIFLF